MRRSSKKRALVAGTLALTGALVSTTHALAATHIGRGLVRGGISTDASAIFTPAGDDSNTFYAGPDLEIVMPDDATVRSAYLVVAGQYNGFVEPNGVADAVRLNGVSLANAAVVEEVGGTLPYKLFDVTDGFGIDGAGSFSIEESAADEDGPGVYLGITGHQLIVQWDSPSAPWALVEAWVGRAMSGQLVTLGAPPACSGTPGAILSVGIGWECTSEQNNSLYVTSSGQLDLVSNLIGGGDDAGTLTPCDSNGAALYSAGSFGFSGSAPVGVDGDDFAGEPDDGNASNNRLSDELFGLGTETYALVDDVVFELAGDGNEAIHALVLVHGVGTDFDCDGTANDDDLCPALPDESPDDFDGDGIGDDCDDDDDDDGVDDETDNCLALANPGQDDLDEDGAGDPCDADDDGDGVGDEVDNCPVDPNADQADADDDGAGDACDPSGVGGGGAGGAGEGGSGPGGGGQGGSGEGAGSGEGGSGEGAGSGEGGSGEGAGSGEGGSGEGASTGDGPSTGQGSTSASGSTSATTSSGAGGDDAGSSGGAADDGGCTVGAGTGTRGSEAGWLGAALAVIAAAWRRRERVTAARS